MGQLVVFGIEESVAADHFQIDVGQERKVGLFSVLRLETVDRVLGILAGVGTDRQDLDFLAGLGVEQFFQLTELFDAKRSPVPAVKDQNDLFVTPVLGELMDGAGFIDGPEVGSGIAGLDPFQIAGREVASIDGSQVGGLSEK